MGYPLHNSHKICRIYTSFQDVLTVKTWMDLLKGLRSYGGFKLRGSDYPRIFSAPSGETMHWTQKRFRGARTCSGSCITVPSLEELGFHPLSGKAKRSVFCLSVCSSRF